MKITCILIAVLVLFPTAAFGFKVSDFQNPYGIAIDEKSGNIYVSNMNGTFDARDGNGFISRLKSDGSPDDLRFISGGAKGMTLHSPKGIAVYDDRLYVADIDKLHVFNLKSGKFVYDINFGDYPIRHFIDITKGPDKALYVTDGPANVVYRIDVPRRHEVTLLVSDLALNQPHGVCWYPSRQIFVITSWGAGKLMEFDSGGRRQLLPSVSIGGAESCAADVFGNLYVSSLSLGNIYRVASNFALFGFVLGQPRPAGVAYHDGLKEIIVASTEGNYVESFSVESSSK